MIPSIPYRLSDIYDAVSYVLARTAPAPSTSAPHPYFTPIRLHPIRHLPSLKRLPPRSPASACYFNVLSRLSWKARRLPAP
jgi:hypothetical protein